MSLTLDASLQAAQDGAKHQPIIEVTSYNPVASIPFDGYEISGLSAETEPKLIMHSSGRLVYVYIYNGLPKFGYSDLERTLWYNNNALSYPDGYTCTSIACCEMTDGNIGIVATFAHNTATTQYIQSMIYTPTGVLVHDRATIYSWTTNETDNGITVAYTGSNYRYIFGAQSGSTYMFRTATTSDFVTWAGGTTFTISTLSSSYPYENPQLFFPINANPILIFNYTESYSSTGDPLKNVYLVESTNGGASWGSPQKISNYTTYGVIAEQPYLSQYVQGEMLYSYLEITPTLFMGWTTSTNRSTGWMPERTDYFYQHGDIAILAYDEENRKFYVDYNNNYGLHGIQTADLDSWTAGEYWTNLTTPALPLGNYNSRSNQNSCFWNGKVWWIALSRIIIAFDIATETYQQYVFGSNGWSWTKNVNWVGNYNEWEIKGFHVMADGTMYMMFTDGTTYGENICWYKMDLTQVGPTFTAEELMGSWYGMASWGGPDYYVRCFPEEGYLTTYVTDFSESTSLGYREIGLFIFDDDGKVIPYKIYWQNSEGAGGGRDVYGVIPTNVPSKHIQDIYIKDNIIYMIMSMVDGIVALDINTDLATTITPSVTGFTGTAFNMGPRFINYSPELNAFMITGNSGLFVYYLYTEEWSKYNSSTIQGITPSGYNRFARAIYDPVNDGFIVGVTDQYFQEADAQAGILFIPRAGKIRQAKYATATYDTSWNFGTSALLIKDYSVLNVTTAYVPNSSEFYAMWSDYTINGNTYNLKWDKNELYFNLTPYIQDDTDVTIRRNITGEPNELTFTLAPGSIFDNWNLSSLLRKYVVKNRKLTVRLGETVSGDDYYVNQGSYYVMTRAIKYVKGEPYVIEITAMDKLNYIHNIQVDATDYKSNMLASDIFEAFATTFGAMDAPEDLNPLPFINNAIINAQFIDTTLYDILYTIAWRYGCMLRYDMDEQLDCMVIPNTTVNHTYSNSNKLLDFSPNDEYSDLTNRVRVTGEYPNDVQILHGEELLAQIAGSAGWWGDPQHYKVYYSEDHEKVALSPRLKVISSIESISFQLAGGVHEEISSVDSENKYCNVYVHTPNLTPFLIAAIAGYIAATYIPDDVASLGGGVTIPVGRIVEGLNLMVALNILGSIASFQYEIWGYPVGYVKRTLEATVDDDENIAFVGHVFMKSIEGWNCRSVDDCTTVGNRELAVVKAQRKRVSITKIAHLQDEEGDMIRIYHPYSGQTLDINIIELERVFNKGSNGYLKDTIQGWVIE